MTEEKGQVLYGGICAGYLPLQSMQSLFQPVIISGTYQPVLGLKRRKGMKENASIIGVDDSDEEIWFYIKGLEDCEEAVCQIGNRICEKVTVSELSKLDIPIRTLVLIDNSLSINEKDRLRIQNILDSLISVKAKNEEYRLAVYGESLTYLSEYSKDAEYLIYLVDNISYENQDTWFTDSLYEAVDRINSENEMGYQRIIVFSDGVDDEVMGYTSDELKALLAESKIPVYSIGCAEGSEESEGLKQLFSLSRLTGAGYYLLDDAVQDYTIVSDINADQNLYCIAVTPDRELLDGSTKGVKFILQTSSGEIELETQIKMKFDKMTETDMPAETEEIQTSVTTAEIAAPVIQEVQTGRNQRIENLTGLFGICCGFFVIMAGLLIMLKGKKGSTKQSRKQTDTLLLPSQNRGTTKKLDDDTRRFQASLKLVLRYKEKMEEDIVIDLSHTVILGRDKRQSDVVIAGDQAISGKHCELYQINGRPFIRDLVSANGTKINGIKVASERELNDKDEIELGKTKLIISLKK